MVGSTIVLKWLNSTIAQQKTSVLVHDMKIAKLILFPIILHLFLLLNCSKN
mgnify:CR=1 FL=1